MKADKKKLELALARACMNAADVSKKAGMPEPTVKNVIYGRSVKPRTFGKFANAIGVDPADIIEQDEQEAG